MDFVANLSWTLSRCAGVIIYQHDIEQVERMEIGGYSVCVFMLWKCCAKIKDFMQPRIIMLNKIGYKISYILDESENVHLCVSYNSLNNSKIIMAKNKNQKAITADVQKSIDKLASSVKKEVKKEVEHVNQRSSDAATIAALQKKIEKMEAKAVKQHQTVYGGGLTKLGFDSKPLMERFLRQMFNPDNVVKNRGELIGVPDDFGENVWTEVIATINTLQIQPDENGRYCGFITPEFRSHIHFSGANDIATPGAATLVGARTFVQKGTKGASSARKSSDYSAANTTFAIDDVQAAGPVYNSAANNPGTNATFPFTMSTKSDYDGPLDGQIPLGDLFIIPVKTPKNAFVFKMDGNSIFNTGTSWIAYVAGTVSNPINNNGSYPNDSIYIAMWFGLGDDVDPTSDICNGVIKINVGDNKFAGTIAAFSWPTNCKIFYVTVSLVKTQSATLGTSNLLEFTFCMKSDAANVTRVLTGSGSTFVTPANAKQKDTWEAYRHVSTGALWQDDSAEIDIQGRNAGAIMSCTDFAGDAFQKLTVESLEEVVGSYSGKSRDGMYAFLLPVDIASAQEYRTFGQDPNLPNSNAIVFAGKVAPTLDDRPYKPQIILRVVSIWQMLTRDLSLNPRRMNYVPNNMTAAMVFHIVFDTFGKGPQVMCNPSHETWGKIFSAIEHFVKRIPAGVMTVGKAAVKTGAFALELAPLLGAFLL